MRLIGCDRSHPHEEMDDTCKRFSDYEERLSKLRGAAQKLELAMSEARDEAAHYKGCIAYISNLLDNDAYAITFQGLGQYRGAIMESLERVVGNELPHNIERKIK